MIDLMEAVQNINFTPKSSMLSPFISVLLSVIHYTQLANFNAEK
jgi:hypothetical protein